MTTKGRPATGYLEWRNNPKTGKSQWFAQISMPDGRRPFEALDPAIPEHDRQGAQACATDLVANVRAIGGMAVAGRERVKGLVRTLPRAQGSQGPFVGRRHARTVQELDRADDRRQGHEHRDARGHRGDR